MTAILACKCSHAYQDAAYGNSNRVHNHAPKAHQGTGGWRCTVCQNVKAEKADRKKKADSAEAPASPKGRGKKGTPPTKTKKKETGNIRGGKR